MNITIDTFQESQSSGIENTFLSNIPHKFDPQLDAPDNISKSSGIMNPIFTPPNPLCDTHDNISQSSSAGTIFTGMSQPASYPKSCTDAQGGFATSLLDSCHTDEANLFLETPLPPNTSSDDPGSLSNSSQDFAYTETLPNRVNPKASRMNLLDQLKEYMKDGREHTMQEIVDSPDGFNPGTVFEKVMAGVKSGKIIKTTYPNNKKITFQMRKKNESKV